MIHIDSHVTIMLPDFAHAVIMITNRRGRRQEEGDLSAAARCRGEAEAAAPSSPPPPPVASPALEATPTAVSRVITTRGGSVVARCDGGRVTLRSRSPAPGYVVDDVEPGPDDTAQVTFARDDDGEDEVEIEVRCSAAGPEHTVEFGRSRPERDPHRDAQPFMNARRASLTSVAWVHSRPCGAPASST